MAGNVNTTPTALARLATKFSALIIGARANKESGAGFRDIVRLTVQALTAQASALVNLINGAASTAIAVGRKTIVDGAATALFDVAIADNTFCGGTIFTTIFAGDGTDMQAMQVTVNYAAVDKAGTKTLTITDLSTTDAKAVSSGTLTLAWTIVTGTGKATVKLQPTGSLTETTYHVTFTVVATAGAVTLV